MTNGIIRLHGRQYKTVALRVHEFREKHPIEEGWGLVSKIIQCDEQYVLFRAAVIDPQGREVAIGFAEEKRTNRGINATSALEVCETSAVGRALAAAGYGGSEYASADELASAIQGQQQQAAQPRLTAGFIAALLRLGLEEEKVITFCQDRGWGHPGGWESTMRRDFLRDTEAGAFPALYTPQTEGSE